MDGQNVFRMDDTRSHYHFATMESYCLLVFAGGSIRSQGLLVVRFLDFATIHSTAKGGAFFLDAGFVSGGAPGRCLGPREWVSSGRDARGHSVTWMWASLELAFGFLSCHNGIQEKPRFCVVVFCVATHTHTHPPFGVS